MRISDWSSDVCSSDLTLDGDYFMLRVDSETPAEKKPLAESRAPVHRHVGDVVAIQGDPAVVGRNEAGDDIEAGGLSRAVGTAQRSDERRSGKEGGRQCRSWL